MITFVGAVDVSISENNKSFSFVNFWQLELCDKS